MQRNGTLPWEDDAPSGSRFRRTQQVLSPAGKTRSVPGMPPDLDDEDDDPRPRKRFQKQTARPWWRPASKAGRIFLSLGALAVIVSAIACWLAAKKYLERDSRFRIAGSANIEASGLTQVSRADMLSVFGEDIGKNIFFVSLSDRRKQLEQIPWIEHATVMRLLPDQIRVNVIERTPIALVRHGQQIGLVDADGVLLTMRAATMTQHHYSFPVITGIDAGDPQPSRKARMSVYQRLMSDLDSSGQHFSNQISEIDLTDPEDARVLMTEPGHDILAHFGDSHFLDRYQRYKAHVSEWREQYPHLAIVDLRYDQQVVLEMAPGTSSVAQTTIATDNGQPIAAANAHASAPARKPAKPVPRKDAKKHPAAKRVSGKPQPTQTRNRAPRAGNE